MTFEMNFDSLVGPTHNYSGLSYGNVASMKSVAEVSNPKEAALQGLEKMLALHRLGIKQAVLPPHERPRLSVLRSIGFEGNDSEVITQAFKEIPDIFIACSSSAFMWAANMATMSPSADTQDHRVHITPANLSSKFHRSIEADISDEILKKIFPDPAFFVHHSPLPAGNYFADEGAANHIRFGSTYAGEGVELFVFGRYGFKHTEQVPKIFPARQTFEASQAIARMHLLDTSRVVFAQQSPEAIDAGVFHNDVISTGNQHLFLYHEKAFVNTEEVIEELKGKFRTTCHRELIPIKILDEDISLLEAVTTYLFNSQIITLPTGDMALIAPTECHENEAVKNYLELLLTADIPIKQVLYFNLRQSMHNGGGPACLRCRFALTEKEITAMNQGVIFTEQLYLKLKNWIETHYREKLHPHDLGDPEFYFQNKAALKELMHLLNL